MPGDKTVLIAEDDADIRNLVAYSLEYAGFNVLQAIDGIDAVDKATTQQPDLILLDVKMPKLNGYEACSQLKQQDSTNGIPIVFLSARGQEQEIKQGLELGAEEYILKPFAPDELHRRVRAILERGQR